MIKKRIFALALTVAALSLSSLSRADDPPAPPPPQDVWYGKGSLGAVIARGNSDTTTVSASADAFENTGDWKHQLGFTYLKAESSQVTSANRYQLFGQSNYSLSSRSYLFGALRYDHDEFSSFDYQATGSVGYGYQWLDTTVDKLNTEIGAGYRRSEVRPYNDTEGDAILRGALNYEHLFNAQTKIFEKFLIEAGSDDVFITNDIGLSVKMSDKLALSLDYQVRNHSKTPDPGVKKTDELFTAAIVFSY